MVKGIGDADGFLSEGAVREVVRDAVEQSDFDGARVLVVIPDSTRTAPIPLFFKLLCEHIGPKARKLDFIIALGTHPPMAEDKIDRLLGVEPGGRSEIRPDVDVFNHSWDKSEALKTIGVLTEDEVEKVSGGLLKESVKVSVNARVFDYDRLVIVGPTFPHEVVGFSGGNKYLFPGISGPEILDFFHWLGALITNPVLNGTKDTPVRRVIDMAAQMIDLPKFCFSLVVTHDGLKGVYAGTPEEAYSAAADLSSEVHIIRVDRPFSKVLSQAPEMYDDIWTAGKCMYKLEPVVADGGELIIYAPHIDEVSYTHGWLLDKIGYHVRDYFVKQWDRFKEMSRGILAHSTHVKGIGTYSDGVETPRVTVILATKIPPERCETINLGYLDPASLDTSEWSGREDEGILYVPRAGEYLYRLSDGSVPRMPDQ